MLSIHNPATGALVRTVEADSRSSVQAKLEAAREAQPHWALLPFARRDAIVQRFAELLAERTSTLAAGLTEETGKPIAQARAEVQATGGRIALLRAQAAQVLEPQTVHRDDAIEEALTYEPLGVIANISAWNYPFYVGTNVFVPALLCGNAVLYKPSEHATLTGLAMASLAHQAGVPKEVFAPVVGGGDVGAHLAEQRCQGVFFTGSYRTGLRIAQAAAGRLGRVQLELGGKDAVYVCNDVDVEVAARSCAAGAFFNAGQSCCAVERIYVHAKVADAFVAALCAAANGYVVGDPADSDTTLGPLTRPTQRAVLAAQIKDAQAKGGQVRCGGAALARPGHFFAPTVVTHCNHTMALMREESFGPIIGVQTVRTDAEAVSLMNDTEFGLTGGVFSRDQARARGILAQLDVGSAYWNCCDRVSARLPWSGRRHSGIGVTLGVQGIRSFVQPKAWHLRRM